MKVHCLKIILSRYICARWILLLMLCLFVFHVHAEEPQGNQANEDEINTDCTDLFPNDPLSKPPTDIFSFLDTPQKAIYGDLESMARYLDSFLSNEQVIYESSTSFARYRLDTLFEEGGQISLIGNLDVSLRLPRTEKKLNLLLESKPPEQQSTLQRATSINTEPSSNNGIYAGLQKEYGKEDKWRFKPSLGLKLRFPVDYYFRLRALREFDFEDWHMNLTESAYWYHSTGSGLDSEMNWTRLFDDALTFQANSLVRYTEQYERFDLSQVFSIIQPLSRRRAVTYSLDFIGNTEPTMHITDYVLQARYRQLLHGNYLYLELLPQVHYSIENAFTQEDSFLLRLEWYFQR